jgi:hypothetical protein
MADQSAQLYMLAGLCQLQKHMTLQQCFLALWQSRCPELLQQSSTCMLGDRGHALPKHALHCKEMTAKAKADAHLEDTHAKCVAKNFVSVVVVAVSDVSGSHKQRKWVFLLWI